MPPSMSIDRTESPVYHNGSQKAESITDTTLPISSAASQDLDDSYDIYKRYNDIEIESAEAKKVLRQIDLRVMPILFVTYMLQYLDKNSINFASVYGLQTGTGLKGQDYSWLGTLPVSKSGEFQGGITDNI